MQSREASSGWSDAVSSTARLKDGFGVSDARSPRLDWMPLDEVMMSYGHPSVRLHDCDIC